MLRGASSAKWIHCGIIIGPYLEQHRPNYCYSRLQLLADDANSYYGVGVDILATSDYGQLAAFREGLLRVQLGGEGNRIWECKMAVSDIFKPQ